MTDFKHEVVLKILDDRRWTLTERTNWCVDNIGTCNINWSWTPYWNINIMVFSFKNPQDATLFALRWV